MSDNKEDAVFVLIVFSLGATSCSQSKSYSSDNCELYANYGDVDLESSNNGKYYIVSETGNCYLNGQVFRLD